MTSETSNSYDLIIIGGGLAGASLACALQQTKENLALKIAVIEAYPLNTDAQPSYDDRTVALSYGSRCIFDSIGLWPALEKHAAAIHTIHISDRGHFGVTRLTREQEGVDALGYVVENKRLGEDLYALMQQDPTADIHVFCPAKLTSLQQNKASVTVNIETQEESLALTGKLLVAADGNNSQVMKLLNIGNQRKDYQQTALITNVTPGKKHNHVAYERFTESGPLAFLPMQNNRCSVVWTLKPDTAAELSTLNDEDFLSRLQQRFGFRLGQIKKVGKRQCYPLFLQAATETVFNRVVIVGNAAHSLHPVAGQGFNLALRDVAILSELIIDKRRAGADIGDQAMLQSYVQLRQQDIKRVYRFTDGLVKTFSNNITALAHTRSLGLLLVDLMPAVKHQMATQSMGLSGRLSRLNRGLRL